MKTALAINIQRKETKHSIEIKTKTEKSIEFKLMDDSPSGIYDIYGFDDNSIFAVGFYGKIFHYDGTTWSKMNSNYSSDSLLTVWGSSKNSVYAAGAWFTGVILHYDGNTWSVQHNTDSPITSIWGFSDSDVYAVSENAVLHYDGNQWSEMNNIIFSAPFQSICGISKDNFFITCSNGEIFHYDGLKWVQINSPTTKGLSDIWGNASNSIFAVGTWSDSATILHFDGNDWKEQNSPISDFLQSVHGNSDNIYATSYSGFLLSYDGQNWTEITKYSTESGGGALWVSPNGNIYIASDNGIVFSEGNNHNEKLYTQAELDEAIINERTKWDANNDNKIGIEEAIYALQISSGLLNESNPQLMVESITFPFNIKLPTGLCFDGSNFYISNSDFNGNSSLHIFNIYDGLHQSDIPVKGGLGSIALDGDYIWASIQDSNRIYKIAKATGEIQKEITTTTNVKGICLYEDILYIISDLTFGFVSLIDDSTIKMVQLRPTSNYIFEDIKYHNGSFWIIASHKCTYNDPPTHEQFAALYNISIDGELITSELIDTVDGKIVALEFVNDDLWYIIRSWKTDWDDMGASIYKYHPPQTNEKSN